MSTERTSAQEDNEAHAAMRERAAFTKDGLLTDKMRYRKALLLACGGDENRARSFLRAVDGDGAVTPSQAQPYPPMPEARIVSYQTDSTMRSMELRTYDEFDMRAYVDADRAALVSHLQAVQVKDAA